MLIHHRAQLIGQRVANDYAGGAWTRPTSRAMREAPRAHAAMVSSGAPPPMAAAGGRLLSFEFRSIPNLKFNVRYNYGIIIAVDNRQSGPRTEPRLLPQAAVEALTNSARTDSPHRVGRKQISGEDRRWRRRRNLRREGGGDSIGYPRMSASGESSTTMHRLLHASGSHPIPMPYDPKTNQYNQDLGLIHSTNGNHLKSPNDDSSIDHQVTIYLHAQNITMFPTNETCCSCLVLEQFCSALDFAALDQRTALVPSW
ncbi:hypothetical protein F511_35224 [Dorcoceras hygrometricum]|uniref:Uncharacterized protein n=1 Tax=Dorcoceras hygrometricum TaxID=472368 RepID=A0A2Z7BE37_9LAMI|nr:hypothetical protein F511_35224 [Dorcoceras hygrometricum]